MPVNLVPTWPGGQCATLQVCAHDAMSEDEKTMKAEGVYDPNGGHETMQVIVAWDQLVKR